MLFDFGNKPDVGVYGSRRKSLMQAIKEKHGSDGVLLLIGGFEGKTDLFIQESSFYYFTGIEEPGSVLLVDFTGNAVLYIPCYQNSRIKHADSMIELTKECAHRLGVNRIEFLGSVCKEEIFGPFFGKDMYANVFNVLSNIDNQKKIYTLAPQDMNSYREQRLVMHRLGEMAPALKPMIIDVSVLVADLRSAKDMGEVELLKGAVNIAIIAHEAAAHIIGKDIPERDVQAGLEGVVTMAGARMALGSCIASGKNSTKIFYNKNESSMAEGDMVVVDIGISYHYYKAHIARTYSVSGVFTKRQRELLDMVVAAQEHIADCVQPGFWFLNDKEPQRSLQHIIKNFFAQRGYDQYFVSDIGYYIGIDVQEEGAGVRPLREGDVIDIAVGLSIPAENIGISIRDNYWLIKNGAICLSEDLPSKAEDIELFMKESHSSEMEEADDEEALFEDYHNLKESTAFNNFNDDYDIEH